MKTKYLITHQKARRILSTLGWRKVQEGYVWYSRCGTWEVFKGGSLYFMRSVSKNW